MITAKLITEAYVFLRTNNHSIPDEVLDFMKDVSLAALDSQNSGKPIVSGSLPSDMLKLCELIINSKTEDGITGRIRDMSLTIRDELKYVHKVGGNDR